MSKRKNRRQRGNVKPLTTAEAIALGLNGATTIRHPVRGFWNKRAMERVHRRNA